MRRWLESRWCRTGDFWGAGNWNGMWLLMCVVRWLVRWLVMWSRWMGGWLHDGKCYDPGPYHQFSFIFPPFISALSVTHSPLVPLRATQTATRSPDKSPDGPPDHSALRYHMPSLRSPQHSAVSSFNPLWIASSLPHHDRLPAHDGAILRTASSWWTLLYMTVLFCDSCDPLLLTCI